MHYWFCAFYAGFIFFTILGDFCLDCWNFQNCENINLISFEKWKTLAFFIKIWWIWSFFRGVRGTPPFDFGSYLNFHFGRVYRLLTYLNFHFRRVYRLLTYLNFHFRRVLSTFNIYILPIFQFQKSKSTFNISTTYISISEEQIYF